MEEMTISLLRSKNRQGFELSLASVQYTTRDKMHRMYTAVREMVHDHNGMSPVHEQIVRGAVNYRVIESSCYEIENQHLKIRVYLGEYPHGKKSVGVEFENIEEREDRTTLEFIAKTLDFFKEKVYNLSY